MATIIKPGSKRMSCDAPERTYKLKNRRQVYEEVNLLKAQGRTRDFFAPVARKLSLTDDVVRNHYKAEEKLVCVSGRSSEGNIKISGGQQQR